MQHVVSVQTEHLEVCTAVAEAGCVERDAGGGVHLRREPRDEGSRDAGEAHTAAGGERERGRGAARFGTSAKRERRPIIGRGGGIEGIRWVSGGVAQVGRDAVAVAGGNGKRLSTEGRRGCMKNRYLHVPLNRIVTMNCDPIQGVCINIQGGFYERTWSSSPGGHGGYERLPEPVPELRPPLLHAPQAIASQMPRFALERE
jgi:hypothetical protein